MTRGRGLGPLTHMSARRSNPAGVSCGGRGSRVSRARATNRSNGPGLAGGPGPVRAYAGHGAYNACYTHHVPKAAGAWGKPSPGRPFAWPRGRRRDRGLHVPGSAPAGVVAVTEAARLRRPAALRHRAAAGARSSAPAIASSVSTVGCRRCPPSMRDMVACGMPARRASSPCDQPRRRRSALISAPTRIYPPALVYTLRYQ